MGIIKRSFLVIILTVGVFLSYQSVSKVIDAGTYNEVSARITQSNEVYTIFTSNYVTEKRYDGVYYVNDSFNISMSGVGIDCSYTVYSLDTNKVLREATKFNTNAGNVDFSFAYAIDVKYVFEITYTPLEGITAEFKFPDVIRWARATMDYDVITSPNQPEECIYECTRNVNQLNVPFSRYQPFSGRCFKFAQNILITYTGYVGDDGVTFSCPDKSYALSSDGMKITTGRLTIDTVFYAESADSFTITINDTLSAYGFTQIDIDWSVTPLATDIPYIHGVENYGVYSHDSFPSNVDISPYNSCGVEYFGSAVNYNSNGYCVSSNETGLKLEDFIGRLNLSGMFKIWAAYNTFRAVKYIGITPYINENVTGDGCDESDVIYINNIPMADGGVYSAHSQFSVSYKGDATKVSYKEYRYLEDFDEKTLEVKFDSFSLGGTKETIYDITVEYLDVNGVKKTITVTVYYFIPGPEKDLVIQETKDNGFYYDNPTTSYVENTIIPRDCFLKSNISMSDNSVFLTNLYSYVEGPIRIIHMDSFSPYYFMQLADGTCKFFLIYSIEIPTWIRITPNTSVVEDQFSFYLDEILPNVDYEVTCSYNGGEEQIVQYVSGNNVLYSEEGIYDFHVYSTYENYKFTVIVDDSTAILEGIEDGLYVGEVSIPDETYASLRCSVEITHNDTKTCYSAIEFAALKKLTAEGEYVIVLKDWEGNVILTRNIFIVDDVNSLFICEKGEETDNTNYNSLYSEYEISDHFDIQIVNDFITSVIFDDEEYTVEEFHNIGDFEYGEHELKFIDRLGNELVWLFIVDDSGPVIKINNLAVADCYNIKGQLINITSLLDEYVRPSSVVLYKGSVCILNGITSGYDFSIHGEGNYKIICEDMLGNMTIYEFCIDYTAPTIVESSEDYSSSLTLQFSDGTSGIDTAVLTCVDNEQHIETGHVITEPGVYTLVVTDKAGHSDEYSFTIYEEQVQLSITGESVDSVYLTATVSYIDEESIIEEAFYKFANGEYQIFTSGTMFGTEGEYIVRLVDKYDRETLLEFEVSDRTKPQANLRGVINGQATSSDVSIDWAKSGITATVSFNSATSVSYDRGTKLTESGFYTVVLSNLAGVTSEYTFTIDKSVSYRVSVPNKVTTNESVSITSTEVLNIDAYCNDEEFTYELGTSLDKDGNYYFVLEDECGNIALVEFSIIKKPKQDFSYHCPEGYTIMQFTLNDQELNISSDGTLSLTEDGIYKIAIRSNVDNTITYTYTVTIDTIAPTIELAGLGENSVAKNSVKLAAPSEPLYSFRVLKDGAETNYEPGDLIRENGEYTVELEDMGGNRTVVEFSVNKQIELMFMIGGAAAAVAILGFAIAIGSLRRKKLENK